MFFLQEDICFLTQSLTSYGIRIAILIILVALYFICSPKLILKRYRNKLQGSLMVF